MTACSSYHIIAAAMKDGRLTVGVTKFDTNYNPSKLKIRSRTSSHILVEKVKQNVIDSIKEATDTEVSDGTIVPLCGEWAFAASMLANCLVNDPNNKLVERQEVAVSLLETYPHLRLAAGEDQSMKQVIQSLSPQDLIDHLENASGISDLKSRYGDVNAHQYYH